MLPFRPEKAEGLDVDSENQTNLLLKYFTLRYLYGEVHVKKSPSGKGYHLYVRDGIPIEVARAAGDCKGRIKYWEKQKYTFTFKKKVKFKKSKVEILKEEDVNIFALPFWISRGVRKR